MFHCSQIKDTKAHFGQLQKYKNKYKYKKYKYKNTNSLFQIPEAPTIASYQLGGDRGTSPIVFLSKMLIRGAPGILGHSVCVQQKKTQERSPAQSFKHALYILCLVLRLVSNSSDKYFFNDQRSLRRGSIETFG